MGLSKNRTNILFLIVLALKISLNLKEKFHLYLTTFDNYCFPDMIVDSL